ncbi:MAG: adenosine deaminase [Chloroflexota bacterium]
MNSTETEISAQQIIAAMPKVELHLHLDGCLRLPTIAELAVQQDVNLAVPGHLVGKLCGAPVHCHDLAEVLSYFATPLRVLQTASALERVTYELCEDLASENVRYVEIRFGPSLHTNDGMNLHQVIDAVVRGWHAGREAFGLHGGIILCALRHMPPAETMVVARAGIPFLGNGVVGFDLAGDEAGFPILLHRDPLLWAKSAGYGMTAHAGEGAGAESVRNAVEVIGVSRVGHGVRAEDDPSLLPMLRERAICLDMCPTSNVQTKSVTGFEQHPAARYYRYGLRVTLSSDNRTVADTNVTRELLLGYERMGLDVPELAAMTFMALEAGFGEKSERQTLVREFRLEMDQLGVRPASAAIRE